MYYAPTSLFRKPPWVGRAGRTLPAPHGGQCRQSGSTNLLVGCGVRTCARTDPNSVALTIELASLVLNSSGLSHQTECDLRLYLASDRMRIRRPASNRMRVYVCTGASLLYVLTLQA